mgnify:CR=1 FL=1
MPIYEFHCPACGAEWDKLIPSEECKYVCCPVCGAKAQQKEINRVSHYWEGGGKPA